MFFSWVLLWLDYCKPVSGRKKHSGTYLVGILLQSMIHVTVDSHVHLLFAVHDFTVYWTNTNNKWLVSFSNVNSLSTPASFPPHVIPAEYIHLGCKCQHIQSSPGHRGRLVKAMLLTKYSFICLLHLKGGALSYLTLFWCETLATCLC